jgi:hypothetical protein
MLPLVVPALDINLFQFPWSRLFPTGHIRAFWPFSMRMSETWAATLGAVSAFDSDGSLALCSATDNGR